MTLRRIRPLLLGLLGAALAPNSLAGDGGVGCSPGYWKTHAETWALTDYAPGDVFDEVFDTSTFGSLTLLEVIGLGGGCEKALGRHAVAGILNASYPGSGYATSDPEDVIAAVEAALDSGDCEQIEALKDVLDGYNNFCHEGCSFSFYCNPSTGNENNYATISISSCDLLDAPVTVDLAGGSPGQFIYLLIGDGTGQATPFRSDGQFCLDGGTCTGRYVKDLGTIAPDGTFSTDISDSATGGPNFGIPDCGGNIVAGATWNFQYWHRQAEAKNSTFSEAMTVTFQ